jgi:hypothetical protein
MSDYLRTHAIDVAYADGSRTDGADLESTLKIGTTFRVVALGLPPDQFRSTSGKIQDHQ